MFGTSRACRRDWHQVAGSGDLRRSGRGPELTKAGGFRLDDLAGKVGIEFMVVTDGSGNRAITYQVPLTYRAGAVAELRAG